MTSAIPRRSTSSSPPKIQNDETTPYSAAKTSYMHIPIDDDFSMSIEELASAIAGWNNDSAQL
jgi:hypothetical protein